MKKSYLSRRDSIVLSAIEIIDEFGINELSIRELARRQGVSEPALYRHFKNKQEIVTAVLDYYSHFDDMLAKTVSDKELDSKEGILFFIKSYLEYYENYRPLTALYNAFETLEYDKKMSQKIKLILDRRFDTMKGIIEAGQERGEISRRLASDTLTDIITGYVRHMILKWRTSNYSFPLRETVIAGLDLLLQFFLDSGQTNDRV